MHLNEIQLSNHLLTTLYAHSLVVTDPVPASMGTLKPMEDAEIAVEKIQFLGKNKDSFVILVNYPDVPHLPDDCLNFLGTVLKACQLNVADVAIVNLARQNMTPALLLAQLSPNIILDFTPAQTMAGLPVTELLQPHKTGLFQYLQSPSLETLIQGGDAVKPQKKQLWEGLKQMLQL